MPFKIKKKSLIIKFFFFFFILFVFFILFLVFKKYSYTCFFRFIFLKKHLLTYSIHYFLFFSPTYLLY